MTTSSEPLRWNYEMDLFRNRYILHLLLKAFGIILCGILLILFILLSGNSEFMERSIGVFIGAGIGAIALILGLISLIYFMTARAKKGKNNIQFEMDETGIRRILTEEQLRKDQALGRLNSIVSVFGTGPNALNAARIGTQLETGSYRTCEFAKVVSVKCLEKYDRIHLREIDKTFEVYADPNQYRLIKQYIADHVSKDIKIKG